MFPYDAVLASAVQTAPACIADVLQVMRAIDGTCVDGDGLKWFNRLYLEVTQAVETRVSAGGFSDPEWLAELDIQFAGWYFAALKAFLTGGPGAECWQVLFASRGNAALARIQFALCGINAHINHDLPEAIVKTCQATSSVPQHPSAQYSDYTSLNSTLDGIIESAKQTLHVRLLGDPVPAVSHLEDTMAAWSVSAARENAWQNSEILWHLQGVPALADGFEDTLDGLTTVVGKALLAPVL
ncbi:MAG TPA: DUF5995 family protein [Bryobacteraceae bacterium]|jgi:hypothetical protein|nr:DUF5995 family protein [Bryobacteraceae bacterium]